MLASAVTRSAIRGVLMVTAKNMKMYSRKPPVIIFGLLFPAFMFMAFYFGRKVDFTVFFPGFAGMTLFFLCSSIGPLITPWEKTAKTYERLLTFPISFRTIIWGDILTGTIYGLLLSSVVLVPGLLLLEYSIAPLRFAAALLPGALCFSSLGTLLSSPTMPNPSHTMMLSSLVRFPLIFVSGIFVPLNRLSSAARTISFCSPITYTVDLLHHGLGGVGGGGGMAQISFIIDLSAVFGFSILFIFFASLLHKKNMLRGF